MKRYAVLLLASLLLAQGMALAQPPPGRERRVERQSLAPRERAGAERKDARRERMDGRERRFTPQEREKLRQDLLDANREMRGRRR
jgi:Ni/Co efflux regulator RcnB